MYILNDLLYRHIDRAAVAHSQKKSKVERVPHRRFRKWYATCYQADQALYLPPTTYHLINFTVMQYDDKKSSL